MEMIRTENRTGNMLLDILLFPLFITVMAVAAVIALVFTPAVLLFKRIAAPDAGDEAFYESLDQEDVVREYRREISDVCSNDGSYII